MATRSPAQSGAGSPSLDAICLQIHCFDPLSEPLVPPELLSFPTAVRPTGTGSTHSYRLVQGFGAANPAWFDALTAVSWESIGYIPRRTAIARVPNGTPPPGGVLAPRWQGIFLPAHRLSPAARDAWAYGPAAGLAWDDGLYRVTALFFRDEDPEVYRADVIATLPPGATLSLVGAPIPDLHPWGEMVVIASAADVDDAIVTLATTSGVQFVDVHGEPELFVDDSAWFLQTGIPDPGPRRNLDSSAVAYRHGLTGHGEVGGVADAGLQHRQCHFVHGGNVADVTEWTVVEYVPGAADPFNVVQSAPLNKAVTNYNLQHLGGTAACAPPNIDNHGTLVAGCMLGDNWVCRAFFDDPFDPEDCPPSLSGIGVQHHDPVDGAAPGAQLVLQNIYVTDFFGGGCFELPDWLTTGFQIRLNRQAYDTAGWSGIGVRAHNRSWGAPRIDQYIPTARALDAFHWHHRDYCGTNSVGNENNDPETSRMLMGFAQSKSALAVAAGQKASTDLGAGPGEDIAPYSSHGPAAWDRLKPDLAAPGGGRILGSEPFLLTPGGDTNTDWPLGSCSQEMDAGTSFAAPTIGGLALQVRQYFRQAYYPSGFACDADEGGFNATNALVKAILINSARNMEGAFTADVAPAGETQDRPTFGQGWGRPVLGDTLFFPGDPMSTSPVERTYTCVLTDTPNGVWDIGLLNDNRTDVVADMKPAIQDGQVHAFPIEILPGEDLHVTLAWSDPPPTMTAADPQVNDLDLEILGPDPLGSPATVVWRPDPGISSVPGTDPERTWSGGYTVLGTTPNTCAGGPEHLHPQNPVPPFCDFVHADRRNQVENVFLRASDIVGGTYTVRVIGFQVASSPDIILAEGQPDLIGSDGNDLISSALQGYALVASGRVMADRGFVHFGSAFHACGDVVTLTLNDRNAAAGAPATLRSFVGPFEDIETVTFGSGPLPQVAVPIRRVDGPGDFTVGDIGNGTLEVLPEAWITAEYADDDPSGHVAHACTRIGSIGQALTLVSADMSDACGDGDGLFLERGDLTYVDVTVSDPGSPAVRALQGFLTTSDPDVVIEPDRAVFLRATPTTWIARFAVIVDPTHACPATIPFTVHLRGDSGCSFEFDLDLDLACGTGTTPARPNEVYAGPWTLPPNPPIPVRVSKPPGTSALQLEWEDGAGGAAYDVYRGRLDLLRQTRAYDHHASAIEGAGFCDLTVSNFADPDDGSPLNLEPYYYLVGETAACVVAGTSLDGPLGFDSFGRERPRGGGCP